MQEQYLAERNTTPELTTPVVPKELEAGSAQSIQMVRPQTMDQMTHVNLCCHEQAK